MDRSNSRMDRSNPGWIGVILDGSEQLLDGKE